MKIVFMGTPQAAVPTLEMLVEKGHTVVEVWTQPDRPSGRGRRLTAPPVKLSAEKLGIPVFQPTKIKTRASRERFVSTGADAAVVVAYGRILTKTYLEAFELGCINVHFSLLPAYRGAAPVNWAIANGETTTGVTTMKMDAGLDTGDILLKRELVMLKDETTPSLTGRLSSIGAELLIETLESFDRIVPRKQDESMASFAPLLSKADGKIDWNMTAETIADRIRAFQPFPKSFSDIGGKRITFWRATADEPGSDLVPGEIGEASGEDLLIGCGVSTVLRVHELQIPGKARTKTRDFINGGNVRKGDKFENG